MTLRLVTDVPDDYPPARILGDVLQPKQPPAEDIRNALQMLLAVEVRFASLALLPGDALYLDALDDAQRLLDDAVNKLEGRAS